MMCFDIYAYFLTLNIGFENRVFENLFIKSTLVYWRVNLLLPSRFYLKVEQWCAIFFFNVGSGTATTAAVDKANNEANLAKSASWTSFKSIIYFFHFCNHIILIRVFIIIAPILCFGTWLVMLRFCITEWFNKKVCLTIINESIPDGTVF